MLAWFSTVSPGKYYGSTCTKLSHDHLMQHLFQFILQSSLAIKLSYLQRLYMNNNIQVRNYKHCIGTWLFFPVYLTSYRYVCSIFKKLLSSVEWVSVFSVCKDHRSRSLYTDLLSLFFPDLPQKCRYVTSNHTMTACLLSLSNLLFVYHPNIQHSIGINLLIAGVHK